MGGGNFSRNLRNFPKRRVSQVVVRERSASMVVKNGVLVRVMATAFVLVLPAQVWAQSEGDERPVVTYDIEPMDIEGEVEVSQEPERFLRTPRSFRHKILESTAEL